MPALTAAIATPSLTLAGLALNCADTIRASWTASTRRGTVPEFVIHEGDAAEWLAKLPDGLARTCVTSPPYFGLRDYGHPGQIGREATPGEYVASLVAVFREVRRVLANDGTLWLNLGDSYVSNPSTSTIPRANQGNGTGAFCIPNERQVEERKGTPNKATPLKQVGLKMKDLIGIPWRVAFALQEDGWYLRSDIIWAKPNPMPESATDRCTKSHEYLFLLSKSARYYCDMDAIAEPSIYGARGSEYDTGKTGEHQLGRAQPRDRRAGVGRLTYDGKRQGGEGEGQEAFVSISETRNKRDVWTIPTTPFPGAHFAVMPEALVEPCVLAGSAEGDMVLDPFAGSGTVGVVALRHQRDFVGIELNPEYAQMARDRIIDSAPLLNQLGFDTAKGEK